MRLLNLFNLCHVGFLSTSMDGFMVYIVCVSVSTPSYCILLLTCIIGCPFCRFKRRGDSADLKVEGCLNVVYGYTRSVDIYINVNINLGRKNINQHITMHTTYTIYPKGVLDTQKSPKFHIETPETTTVAWRAKQYSVEVEPPKTAVQLCLAE